MTRAALLRDDLVARIDDTGFRAHGVHVRVGDDTATHRWTPDVREEIHSVAKAVAVLAAGIAVDEGVVSLDEPVSEMLPTAADVTLRHLLTMSSGIDLPYSATMMSDWPDLAAEFLSRPSRGRVFHYSNASTYTAMHALSQRTGDVEDYLRPRLFAPLGLDDVSWRRCPNGRVLAGEGLALRTEEMARLGLLIRDRGVWSGRRLVSAETVDAMHSGWIDTGGVGDGYRRYALSGWEGPGDAWRLHGAHGQLVVFASDAVVTISADDHAGADAVALFIAEVATP
ncbi:CubicO group peptidase, beta-lactamase class C family [Microbacterium sp. ru370.1]|uniref:serine hydrolase domain-containing protein n=1 Tax=unclassified Microbacterium TaxID=2609290 RepID=UPI000885A704|nr:MULTISPECIES: serine hydrolase [unclassified Microbacterium]SDO36776.1 CubicO group peptidase, beta-lactamase class C family [Microbacterium sp. ru370.1]SIT78248.1 CubicO group peptidase, beta-lactamase class C family [Microbacterium sp. RU1D]